MGLDMYLERKLYIKNWDPDRKGNPQVIQSVDPHIKEERLKEITEEIAYWRKANHIHKWFVDHVQNGEDDCNEYRVTLEQLTELRDTCAKVLKHTTMVTQTMQETNYHFDLENKTWTTTEDPVVVTVIRNDKAAKALLPTQEGFFFGGTWYDDYYIETTQYTFDTISQFLKDEEEDKLQMEEWRSTLYYQSSW